MIGIRKSTFINRYEQLRPRLLGRTKILSGPTSGFRLVAQPFLAEDVDGELVVLEANCQQIQGNGQSLCRLADLTSITADPVHISVLRRNMQGGFFRRTLNPLKAWTHGSPSRDPDSRRTHSFLSGASRVIHGCEEDLLYTEIDVGVERVENGEKSSGRVAWCRVQQEESWKPLTAMGLDSASWPDVWNIAERVCYTNSVSGTMPDALATSGHTLTHCNCHHSRQRSLTLHLTMGLHTCSESCLNSIRLRNFLFSGFKTNRCPDCKDSFDSACPSTRFATLEAFADTFIDHLIVRHSTANVSSYPGFETHKIIRIFGDMSVVLAWNAFNVARDTRFGPGPLAKFHIHCCLTGANDQPRDGCPGVERGLLDKAKYPELPSITLASMHRVVNMGEMMEE